VRIGRVRLDDTVYLARLEAEEAVLLAEEPDHVGADVLRAAIAMGVDLSGGGRRVRLEETRLLAPVVAPQKILAIGLNYRDHAREAGVALPESPVVFAKTPNAIIGPDDSITFRAEDSSEVDFEAELAVVIGRRARRVAEPEALGHVLGYTVCNDVSARDAQFGDGQWVRGKSFDTFCPLGPWVVTADEVGDVQNLGIRARVNGALYQDSSTSEMVFGVAALVSYVSRFLTLEPGDVIATGTPHGVGFARTPPVFLGDGDLVECEVDGIGRLANPVRVVPTSG